MRESDFLRLEGTLLTRRLRVRAKTDERSPKTKLLICVLRVRFGMNVAQKVRALKFSRSQTSNEEMRRVVHPKNMTCCSMAVARQNLEISTYCSSTKQVIESSSNACHFARALKRKGAFASDSIQTRPFRSVYAYFKKYWDHHLLHVSAPRIQEHRR